MSLARTSISSGIGDDDLVFCSEVGAHLNSFGLRRRYYRALKRAGLRRIRFHDLRHAFGSAAITKLDPYAVQCYMGHQHYSTTQRYLHHKPRREDAPALQEAFARGGPWSSRSRSPVTVASASARLCERNQVVVLGIAQQWLDVRGVVADLDRLLDAPRRSLQAPPR